jgi:hypothetical protein
MIEGSSKSGLSGVEVNVSEPLFESAAPDTLTLPRTTEQLPPLAREVNWYVRTPSGGQYGPARGTVFRSWIDEGRVSGDALVWREGWPEWQSAGSVFPELAPSDLASIPRSDAKPDVETDRSAAAESPPTTTARRVSRRRSNRLKPIAIVIFLACIVAALLVALVLVVQQSS